MESGNLEQPSVQPWEGFVHARHRSEELEPLLRTLRFASIQLGKFWVELNAFPVFMNEMKGASTRQIERLFDWFQAAPSWSERVKIPALVPELCDEAARATLLEFAGQVLRARLIQGRIARLCEAPVGAVPALVAAAGSFGRAQGLASGLGLEEQGLPELERLIAETSERLERNERLQAFFGRLANECALGSEASHGAEAACVLEAIELIRQFPVSAAPWRRPQILAAQNRARILAWQDRARPLVEARRRIEGWFKTEEALPAAQLRRLAEQLLAGRWFKKWGREHKSALKAYRELLKAPAAKEPREQMVAKLTDWAGFLETRAQLEEADEARALFGPAFKGIDTDFKGALEVNAWACTVRAELESDSGDDAASASFRAELCHALLSAPQERLALALEVASGPACHAIQAVLYGEAREEYAGRREFAALACDEEARWLGATELREILGALGFKPELTFRALTPLKASCLELAGVLEGLAAHAQAQALFRQSFAAERTDLGPLEAAQDYIDFVRGAELSPALKATFLTAHGPQRLQGTRNLVAPALAGLAHVKEHLRRLQQATHGRSAELEELPLVELNRRIQDALKNPSLFAAEKARMGELPC